MSQVSFYILEDEVAQDPASETTPAMDARLKYSCEIAARCYRAKKRCLVLCQDQAMAEQFDELLWQLPSEAFIPHNLSGEGPIGGAPIEICWQAPSQFNRPVLLNLRDEIPEFHQRFKQIYDFVPAEAAAKQLARERYKQYRSTGAIMDTQVAASLNEKPIHG